MHRLGRFAETYPDIDLRVSATLHHVDFVRDDIDMAIRHGDGTAQGLDITRLYSEELFPVCSPKLLQGNRALLTPADLAFHTLLHLDHRHDWDKWLDIAKVKNVDLSRGLILNQASNIIDAAVDGQGVALARTGLAAHDLLSGRLVRPFTRSLPVSYAYWIVYPKAVAKLPKISLFRDWLLAEAAEDQRRLAEIMPMNG